MRRRLLNLLVVFILLLLLPDSVMAATRGLILLGNFRHWADLAYDYDGQTSEAGGQSSSSTQQRFEEDYHFIFDYALYHPRILVGQFSGDIKTHQQLNDLDTSSTSSTGTDFLYRVSGTVLDRSPYPLTFVNALEYTNVQQEFASSYDMKVSTNGLGFSLSNKYLPFTVNYNKSTSETTGLPQDRTDTNETIHFSMANAVGGISHTSLNMLYSNIDSVIKGTGTDVMSRAYDVSLSNTIAFNKEGLGRGLNSTVQLHQQAGSTEYSSLTLAESLNWDLGKALSTNTSVSYTNRNTPQSGTESSTQGIFSIQHRFLQSVTTQLQLNYRKDQVSTGDETEVGGTVGLVYLKKLPQESNLQVSLAEQYTVDERNLTSPDISVIDEQHKVALPARVLLNNTNVLLGTVVVKNILNPVPYILGTDYTLLPFGAQTEVFILPGSQIHDGDTLLISYVYEVNPQIKYATTTRRVAIDLPLFNEAYRFYGRYVTINQELLSGQSNITHLTDSQEYVLGVECKRLKLTYGAEYGNYDSDTDKHEYYDAHARITRQYGRNTVNVGLADRVTITYPNAFTTGSNGTIKQNTTSVGVVYNRPLISNAQLLMTGNYIATRGDLLSRDNASVSVNIRWNYGKLMFSLIGQSNWQMVSGSTSRDDHVRLRITRYF